VAAIVLGSFLGHTLVSGLGIGIHALSNNKHDGMRQCRWLCMGRAMSGYATRAILQAMVHFYYRTEEDALNVSAEQQHQKLA
jgi:hypothetical protein